LAVVDPISSSSASGRAKVNRAYSAGVLQGGGDDGEVVEIAQVVLGRPGQELAEGDAGGRGAGAQADRLLAGDGDVQAGRHREVAVAEALRCGERDPGRHARLPGDVPHGPGHLDPAVAQDRHPVGQPLRLVQVVGGEQDGLAERAQVLDRAPAAAARLGIETGRRLVEEDQVRVAREREGQVEAAALAAGEPAHLRVLVLVELDDAEQVAGGAGVGVVRAPAVDQLFDPGLAGEAALLQDDADPLAELGRLRLRVHAEDGDGAAGPPAEALEDLDGGGLARAVGAEEAEDLAAAHVEVDAAQHLTVAVAHGEGADLDRVHGRSGFFWGVCDGCFAG
jgi:hypothetical protein